MNPERPAGAIAAARVVARATASPGGRRPGIVPCRPTKWLGRVTRASVAVAAVAALSVPAATVGAIATANAGEATQTQIESDLTCQCGCGLTVHTCNHLNCGSGIPLKKEIGEQISKGGTREDILAYFQSKYGEKILSSPTATGFNLAAWMVPFVAIGLGGLLIGLVLARWRRSSDRLAVPSPAGRPEHGIDAERRARLDAALEDFDRRS